MLSVILPAYNEEDNIEKAYQKIRDVLFPEKIAFEIVFVNDGSVDNTFRMIRNLAGKVSDAQIIGVSFSRNFGKEAAIYAGLSHATGDVCAVMDCDMQHPPETLIEMYRLWERGFEIIEGIKRSRGKENIFYKGFAKLFYSMISKSAGIEMYRASDFKMLDRKVVNEYIKLPERNIFFRALSSWLGYKSVTVEFDVQERASGTTKWSVNSLIKYAIRNICSFTTAPMQLITVFGTVFLVFSLILGIHSLIKWATGYALEGFTTVILLLLITGSLIMISLGIVGYYLAGIYEEIKGRPRYIVDKIVKTSKEEETDRKSNIENRGFTNE